MGRPLWCMKCAAKWEQVAGELPAICPGCQRATVWSVEEVPAKRYALSMNDRRFLRSIKITPDED